MEHTVAFWQNLATKYTNDNQLVRALWTEIKRGYTNKKRHYHDLTHMKCMVDHTTKYHNKLLDPDTVLFSIFYHDIVYDATQKDNELKSANIAQERLFQL